MALLRPASLVSAILLTLTAGCARPVLTRDGQLVFQQKGAHGATVLTANGVEFLDSNEIPQPVVRRSPDEPWQPATGFLLPPDGIWRKTATPVAVQGHGLAVVLRSSDVIVPSWGGEILLRLDALAPAAAFPKATVRASERLAIVLDGSDPDTVALADSALDDLGGADRAAIVDATAAQTVLPPLPGSHRTLLHAAVERRLAQGVTVRPRLLDARDLAGALRLARGFVSGLEPGQTAHVLVLTDGVGPARGGPALDREVDALAAAGVRLTAVATVPLDERVLAPLGQEVWAGMGLDARRDAIEKAVPPPGDIVLEDVNLDISSVPAPARVIEVSGGDNALGLYADHYSLGQVYAGEARTEVARVVLPPWVPGEPLELTVTSTYKITATGATETAHATIRCKYSEDVEQIARARHGDVIAYASALAMVRRLHRAFLGSEMDRPGKIRHIAGLQASSLAQLARVQQDPALGVQAEILSTLLGVIED